MEQLLKRCKCGVYLSVNEHRDIYQSVEERIAEINDRHKELEIDAELAKRMVETGEIYELQYYPDTPVGFYVVYGTSFDEVVSKALHSFDDE